MTLILPADRSLEQTGDALVQNAPRVHWINEREVLAGTVQIVAERPSLAQWTAWVDQVGGQWATDQELAHL